ncbi:hypothetical protein LY78DRAFT_655171 [Colletotrichum sublineola]|nr:hypothetical protein LY78DRAFT_655171 [Colletotrichum sublineola]
MKAITFYTAFHASSISASAAALLIRARDFADGIYQVTVDDSGNAKTAFTPWAEIFTNSGKPTSPLEKRREAYSPGLVSTNEADEANKYLVDSFSSNTVYFNKIS